MEGCWDGGLRDHVCSTNTAPATIPLTPSLPPATLPPSLWSPPNATTTAKPSLMRLVINGSQLELARRYAAGDVLSASEALALDALRAENIRNNLAKQAKGESVSQERLDAYAASYQFPQRRLSESEEDRELELLAQQRGQTQNEILAQEARERVALRRRLAAEAVEELI